MALNYGTSTAITLGTAVNSLANSLTSVVQSAAVTTPTTNNITECHVRVTVTVGTVASPYGVNVYAFASEDGSTFPEGCTETVTTGAVTLSANGNGLKFLGQIPTPISSVATVSEPFSIGLAFGGTLPRKWGLVIQNQSGAALAASGHSASYTPVYYN